MKLVLATTNANKVKEITPKLPASITLLSLKDISFEGDIPEDHDNLEDNSLQKAMTIWKLTGLNCLAEDTGLFVRSLDGEPGVYSARYAGDQKNDADNIRKLLDKLAGKDDRSAYFKTVMTLIIDGKAYLFSGILEGHITEAPAGTGGFGYDPVFSLANGKTLAEIPAEEKRTLSHRAIALGKVLDFLEQYKR